MEIGMEESVLLFVQEHIRQGWLNGIVVFITKLGDMGFFWIALTLLLFCIPKTRKTGLMCLTSIGIIHIVNNLIIKNLVGRIRPYDAISQLQALVPPLRDSSFPSGHSACSFAVAVVDEDVFVFFRCATINLCLFLHGFLDLLEVLREIGGRDSLDHFIGNIEVVDHAHQVAYLLFHRGTVKYPHL